MDNLKCQECHEPECMLLRVVNRSNEVTNSFGVTGIGCFLRICEYIER